MPFGLKDIEIYRLKQLFAADGHIETVILYGSRAKGTYKPFSDVDITLTGDDLTHENLVRLSLAIDDLLLPASPSTGNTKRMINSHCYCNCWYSSRPSLTIQ